MRAKLLFAVLVVSLLNVAMTYPARAAPGECWVYDIEATTTTAGGTYSYSGVLVVFPEPIITSTGTSTPANEWEFWLQLGNPTTNPSPGAIYFATNSGITNTTSLAMAQLQLADIQPNSEGYFEVYPRLYESQQMVNLFNISGGFTATPFTITDGAMGIAFSEDFNEVGAVVEFLGRSQFTVGTRADVPYQAEIEGTFAETSTSCTTAGR